MKFSPQKLQKGKKTRKFLTTKFATIKILYVKICMCIFPILRYATSTHNLISYAHQFQLIFYMVHYEPQGDMVL